MRIVLEQNEFEKMAAAWVYEHLVEKKFYSATIVGDAIELEVFAEDSPPKKLEEDSYPEENFASMGKLSSFYDNTEDNT